MFEDDEFDQSSPDEPKTGLLSKIVFYPHDMYTADYVIGYIIGANEHHCDILVDHDFRVIRGVPIHKVQRIKV